MKRFRIYEAFGRAGKDVKFVQNVMVSYIKAFAWAGEDVKQIYEGFSKRYVIDYAQCF